MQNKTVAHTFLSFSCVGATRKVSPDWSQKTMICHSFNCFSIVWGQGKAPFRSSSCYMTPSIIRQCKCPSLSRKIVEVQKFGCHVNVTSHFSLFSYLSTLQLWWKPKKTADISRHHCRMFSQASRDVKKCYLQTLSTQESRGIQTVLSKLRDATASTSGRLYNWSTFWIDPSKHVVFFQLLKRTMQLAW